jgi:hypothetical protein
MPFFDLIFFQVQHHLQSGSYVSVGEILNTWPDPRTSQTYGLIDSRHKMGENFYVLTKQQRIGHHVRQVAAPERLFTDNWDFLIIKYCSPFLLVFTQVIVLRYSVCKNARGGRPQGQGTIGDLVRHNTARIAVGFAYNSFDVVL